MILNTTLGKYHEKPIGSSMERLHTFDMNMKLICIYHLKIRLLFYIVFFNQCLQSPQRQELCHSSKPNFVSNGFVRFYRDIPSRKEPIVV